MAKTVMGSRKQPRIKRGSQSYHEDVTKKDYKPGQTSGYSTETNPKAEAARQAQIKRETEAANERRAKEKRQRTRGKYRRQVVAVQRLGRALGDASNTPGEKAAPRGGGRAKASAARAAATKAKNIAASKAKGTYVRSTTAQTARNRAAARSDARTRVGGGSPGSRVAGGLARARGR